MANIAIPFEPLMRFGFQRILPGEGWKYTEKEPRLEETKSPNYLGKVRSGSSIIVRRTENDSYVTHRVTDRGKLIYAEDQNDTEIRQLSKEDEINFILKRPARINIEYELINSFINIARFPIEEDIEPTLNKIYNEIIKYPEPMRTTLEWEFDCAIMARSIRDPDRYIRP